MLCSRISAPGWLLVSLLAACSARHAGQRVPVEAGEPEAIDPDAAAAAPTRPWALNASRDLEDRVQLRWRAPADEPDGYVIVRDDAPIAELPAAQLRYDDRDAAPCALEAPALSASHATRSDGIELHWTRAATAPGTLHRYLVYARHDDALGDPSEPALGQRGAPQIRGHELCREPCATWLRLDGDLSYVDRGVGLHIRPGRSTARAHLVPSAAVSLLLAEAEAVPVDVAFRVRAWSASAVGPSSLPALGSRAPGGLDVQWQRRGPGDADFVDLPGVTDVAWLDAAPPLDSALQYRARVRAEGAEEAYAEAASVRSAPAATEIALSYRYGCALVGAGELRCWGGASPRNDPSRLAEQPAPGLLLEQLVVSDTGSNTGAGYACALERGSGRLHCWGDPRGSRSNLGPQPVEFLAPDTRYRALTAANADVCAVRSDDGQVDCFQLNRDLPEPAHVPAGSYTDVAFGAGKVCALRGDDGAAVCGVDSARPGPFVQLHGDQDAICGRRADGVVLCWSPTRALTAPVPLRAFGGGLCGLAAADGRVVCWGDESGFDSLAGRDYRALSWAGSRGCGVTREGRIECRGGIIHSGVAPPLPSERPFTLLSGPYALDADGALHCLDPGACAPLPAGRYANVVAGPRLSCALDPSQRVVCAGAPYRYDTPPPDVPMRVIAGYGDQFCGLRAADDALVCWGHTAYPLLGLEAASSALKLQSLAIGWGHACGLDAEGRLHCLGQELGLVPTDTRYDALSAGDTHVCALEADSGALRCWGVVPSGLPRGVDSSDRFLALTSGSYHVCALRAADRRALCWGGTRLADGVSRQRYRAIRAYQRSTCALRESDARRVCWGEGYVGDDGDPVVTP